MSNIDINIKLTKIITDSYHLIKTSSSWTYFNHIIDNILRVTESKFGFIGEIKDGFLCPIGITNISWTSQMNNNFGPGALKFSLDKRNLLIEAILKKSVILTNDPTNHEAFSGRIPKKHLHIETFLSIPIFDENNVIGLIAIANKEGEYSDDLIQPMKRFACMLHGIMVSYEYGNNIKHSEDTIVSSSIFNYLTNGIILVNNNYKIIYANTSIKNIFSESIQNKKMTDLFPDLHDLFLLSETKARKNIIFDSNNGKLSLDFNVTKINMSHDIVYLIEINNDEDNENIKNSDIYISILMHNIRNHLQTILFSLFILLNEKSLNNLIIKKHNNTIMESIKIISNLTNETQRFVDDDAYTIENSRMSCENLIHKINNHFKTAVYKNVKILFNNDIHNDISSDIDKLESIICNIILTTVTKILKGTIYINIMNDSKYLYIDIKDNGKGFEEDELTLINDIINNKKLNKDILHISANLQISYRLILLLNGTLKIEAVENMGTKYKICIPIEQIYKDIANKLKGNIIVVQKPSKNRSIIINIISCLIQKYKDDLININVESDYDIAQQKLIDNSYNIIIMDTDATNITDYLIKNTNNLNIIGISKYIPTKKIVTLCDSVILSSSSTFQNEINNELLRFLSISD
jgi:nitrogen-specific signal transduction histidine kinase